RDRKRQPHVHADRVILELHVHEIAQPRVLDHRWIDLVDLLVGHAVDGCVEVDVFTAAQLQMEPGPELDERADLAAAPDEDAPLRGPMDAGDELQQRALARSIAPDEADRLSMADAERDVAQRPQLLALFAAVAMEEGQELRLQIAGSVLPQPVPLRHVTQID